MKIGRHHSEQTEWDLGDLKIENSESYTYLGDVITSDGKNTKNIENRKTKLIAATIHINTIAESEVLQKIESSVLLELHEKINIPKLLTNAESWDLLIGEKNELDKTEIQALKSLFDLPIRTPNAAIIYSFGTLSTNLRIDKKQLIYLHKLLTRDTSNWTRKTLQTLNDLNIGWYKNIRKSLEEYQLSTDFEKIKRMPLNEWKNKVSEKIEIKNHERLQEECYKVKNGVKTTKTKTAKILDELQKPNYKRQPLKELQYQNKIDTKTLIIARNRMLECGQNFKGTQNETCNDCCSNDDEEHRLNHCIKYIEINYCNSDDKIPFNSVFSSDLNILTPILKRIRKVWNINSGHGTMNDT